MVFPSPSETFASNDIKGISRLVADVQVFSLKKKRSDHNQLVTERKLEGIKIYTSNLASIVHGVLLALINFRLLIRLIKVIFQFKSNSEIKHFFRQFILIPRAFDISHQLKKKGIDTCHLFW